jgi:hypothetical protein
VFLSDQHGTAEPYRYVLRRSRQRPTTSCTVGTFCASSVILASLASPRYSARSQCIANLVSNAAEVEQGFLKPSTETAIDKSRTRFQSASLLLATLGSLAVLARLSSTERFLRSSRLNQTRIHPPAQVVLKNHATDLDLIDRAPTKPPAHPAGNLQLPTSTESAGQDACEAHASMRALWLFNRLRRGNSHPQQGRSSYRSG